MPKPDDYINKRDKYKPSHIRLLFIAESPPKAGGYFYFDYIIGRDYLFVETMKALGIVPLSKIFPDNFNKTHLLERFKSKGFYLIDVSYQPVDNMKKTERQAIIKRNLPNLIHEVEELNPDNIVIVKASLFEPVRKALEEKSLDKKLIDEEPLKFPSNHWQEDYRNNLHKLISKAGLDW